MKRITPSEILEAYKSTGYQPTRRTFVVLDEEDRIQCACPLTALARVKGADEATLRSTNVCNFLSDLGYTIEYLVDFYTTIDGGYDYSDGEGNADAFETIRAMRMAGLVHDWPLYAKDPEP